MSKRRCLKNTHVSLSEKLRQVTIYEVDLRLDLESQRCGMAAKRLKSAGWSDNRIDSLYERCKQMAAISKHTIGDLMEAYAYMETRGK